MRFTKMHGLGNDYVVVDTFSERVGAPAALARVIADRRRGVGCDGLLLVGPADDADVRMEIYNSDGSRAAMCGNGLRCVAKFAYEHGRCRRSPMRVATDSGLRIAECIAEGNRVVRVRVAMGAADYRPHGLPAFAGRDRVMDEPFVVHGRTLHGTLVSMGNPHLVIFVRDFAEILLDRDGPALETHASFPDRINVHFARVDSRGAVTMVSWERGAGAVQACGTGSCAVADAAFAHELADFPMTVHLPGGDLLIERETAGGLHMAGPAEEVFTGEW